MSDTDEAEGAMQVDTDLVRQLAEMLHDSDLSEIEVQDGSRRIVVKRKLAAAYQPAPAATAPAVPPASAPGAPAAEDSSPANHPGALKSPMVGTVYLSGEPGAPPFAPPGAKVSEGDTLLIIEAMKVMNPITAAKAGIVRQILVVDGQPVEYDQPLMIVE
jgi:acetyl-CoA carboxylase biotin carboxyl carrier protein